ncbi:hypothetical protein MINTM003_26120 [Mycobacterium paraintracellulare]|nr:hypothetical protein MINTM003_26120 [Mycobacterium paraintracellulare]
MRQRTRRLDTLLLEGDGGSLGLADPDRQVTVTVGFAQQQHRLVLRLLYANADNTNLTHLCLSSAFVAPVGLAFPAAARSKIRPTAETKLSTEV